VDLVLLLVGLTQALDREAGLLRGFDDDLLAARQEIDSGRDLATASAGITTAPWRSAWMMSLAETTMPPTVTVPPKSTRWTYAWLGITEPARRRSRATSRRVAHRAVGDHPDAAEPGVHMGLHLAPESAEPVSGASMSWSTEMLGKGAERRARNSPGECGWRSRRADAARATG